MSTMIILSKPGMTIFSPDFASLLYLPNLSTSPVSKGLIILNILNNTTPSSAIITTHLTIPNIISII